MVDIKEPPEPEPEVLGIPGHVHKMIHLFSNGIVLHNHTKAGDNSLANRNGVNHSGTSASVSKRTLCSADSISAASSGHVVTTPPAATTTDNQTTSPGVIFHNNEVHVIKVQPAASGLDTTDNDIKPVTDSSSPSYLRLSCSVGGYSNKYVPPSPEGTRDRKSNSPESRLRVLKKSEQGQNSSNSSSVSSLSEYKGSSSSLQNGQCDLGHGQVHPALVNGASSTTPVHQSVAREDSPQLAVHKKFPVPAQGGGDRPPTTSPPLPARPTTSTTQDTHTLDINRDEPDFVNVPGARSRKLKSPGHVGDITAQHEEHPVVVNGIDVVGTTVEARIPVPPDIAADTQSVEAKPESVTSAEVATVTPIKDGAYFKDLVQSKEDGLRLLCQQAEADLTKAIPEDASGKLRAAIGKANLLISEKFRQYRGLCDQNLNPDPGTPRPNSEDLAGFWDMVLLQVEELHTTFTDIQAMRNNNWHSPVQGKPADVPDRHHSDLKDEHPPGRDKDRTPVKKARARSSRPRDSAATPRSSKALEAQKAREEARKRLMAAKKAGRERKASQSDEVEIFTA